MFLNYNGTEVPRLFIMDAYKQTQVFMYNRYKSYTKHSNTVYGYIAPRKDHPAGYMVSGGINERVEMVTTPLSLEEIHACHQYCLTKGYDFDVDAWESLYERYNGHFPIEVRGVPDGMKVDNKTPMVTLQSRDPEYFWLVPVLMDAILPAWYTCEVATNCSRTKELLDKSLSVTAANNIDSSFMFHNFGARACPTVEQSILGGKEHLKYFNGTDNMDAAYVSKTCSDDSINAMEHNMFLVAGEDNEFDLLKEVIEDHLTNGKMVSILFDTFDRDRCLANLATLRDDMLKWYELGGRKGKIVFRNDSGDPVNAPIELLNYMFDNFGYTVNEKGYMELPSHLGAMQGDGTNYYIIELIINKMIENAYAVSNMVFGQGGSLMNGYTRDDRSWSAKLSVVETNGVTNFVSKNANGKHTLSGYFCLNVDGSYDVVDDPSLTGFYQLMYSYPC